ICNEDGSPKKTSLGLQPCGTLMGQVVVWLWISGAIEKSRPNKAVTRRLTRVQSLLRKPILQIILPPRSAQGRVVLNGSYPDLLTVAGHATRTRTGTV